MRQARQRYRGNSIEDLEHLAPHANSNGSTAPADANKGNEIGTVDIEDQAKLTDAVSERELRHSILHEVVTRGQWLLGLLVLQSSSSFVLQGFTGLLQVQ